LPGAGGLVSRIENYEGTNIDDCQTLKPLHPEAKMYLEIRTTEEESILDAFRKQLASRERATITLAYPGDYVEFSVNTGIEPAGKVAVT
jgi:hypothetical protein